jgi:ribosome-binding protein aMBF1 (putative translation factor)
MLIIVCGLIASQLVYYCYPDTKKQEYIVMKKRILVKFGRRIREERIKRGLSQEELAALASVHRTYIGMIERAEKNVTLSNVEKLAQALRVRIGDLTDD